MTWRERVRADIKREQWALSDAHERVKDALHYQRPKSWTTMWRERVAYHEREIARLVALLLK